MPLLEVKFNEFNSGARVKFMLFELVHYLPRGHSSMAGFGPEAMAKGSKLQWKRGGRQDLILQHTLRTKNKEKPN